MAGQWVYLTLVALVLAVAAGLAIGYLIARSRTAKALAEAELNVQNSAAEVQRVIAQAESKAKTIELDAQHRKVKIIEESEADVLRRRKELERLEERVQRRQETLDNKIEQVDARDRRINQREARITKREGELAKQEEERVAELARIAGMTQEDARQELLAIVEQETRQDMARKIREVEAGVQAHADQRAREVISCGDGAGGVGARVRDHRRQRAAAQR